MDWLKKIKAIIDNMEDYKAQAQVNRNVLDDPRLTDWWDGAYHTTRDWLKDVQQLYIDVAEVTPTGYDVYCAQDAPAFATWERVAWFADVLHAHHYARLLSYPYYKSAQGLDFTVVQERYDKIAAYDDGEPDELIAIYRILPAGSPPPGNEVGK